MREINEVARANSLARANERSPFSLGLIEGASQEDFDLRATSFVSTQAGRKHAGVIQDEAIAGPNVLGEVRECVVVEGSGSTRNDQHARIAAASGRFLRDQFFRKLIIEIRNLGQTLILGIESSCDETAAAVVEDGREIRSSVVASQLDTHANYGGVVPELASREHLARHCAGCA